ncbi:ABC transporter ATP-binding protein, partial [Achromobacter sp. 2789STDY5608628]
DGIDGVVTEGQRVALVGASGSGKSTLASLLARMWDPDRGAIRIGGVDLRDMAARTLNQRVALMLQEVALFRASVADNLRLGRPDASLDEVMAAARAAHAHGFIERLPQGYETVLDESVIRLSGGERQRLAIARALLKNAPILVLDEALASVDPENAWEIQRALDELARGRTVLAIAHQLRSVVDADAIWVMRDGRIVERGRHAALLAANGEYARLWRAQAPD